MNLSLCVWFIVHSRRWRRRRRSCECLSQFGSFALPNVTHETTTRWARSTRNPEATNEPASQPTNTRCQFRCFVFSTTDFRLDTFKWLSFFSLSFCFIRRSKWKKTRLSFDVFAQRWRHRHTTTMPMQRNGADKFIWTLICRQIWKKHNIFFSLLRSGTQKHVFF